MRGLPLAAAVVAGMVAMSVANVLPVMVGVLADRMALDSRQAGLVASADIAGLAVGSVLCVLLRGVSFRLVGALGLLALAAANLATLAAHGFEALAAIRFAGGLGGGFALAVCYAVLGAGDATRGFAVFNTGQIAVGWLAMLFAPQLLGSFGWQGLFGLLAILALAAAVLALALPHAVATATPAEGEGRTRRVGAAGVLAVASVLVYFTGQGGVWAYLDRMGAARGFSAAAVSTAIAWSMFAGMAASGLATWLDAKRGLLAPLLAGFAITTAGLFLLWGLPTPASYLAAAAVFVFGWNAIVPYQFAAVARADPDGRLAMLASTASVAGLALGPFLVAPLAARGDYATVRAVALGMNAVSLALLLPAVRRPATASPSI